MNQHHDSVFSGGTCSSSVQTVRSSGVPSSDWPRGSSHRLHHVSALPTFRTPSHLRMQLAVSYPRAPRFSANFANSLPRQLDLVPDASVRSADSMIAPTGMSTFGSGLAFGDKPVGQSHTLPDQLSAGRLNTDASRLGGHLARLEQHLDSRESFQRLGDDAWPIHCSCTNCPPYPSRSQRAHSQSDAMMTQTSLLTLPKDNASHDLAFFLRTTGPTASRRHPRRVGAQPSTSVNSTKPTFTVFRRSQRRTKSTPITTPARNPITEEACLTGMPEDLRVIDDALRDEGGLLKDVSTSPLVPRGVLQKVSTTGKKYYALQIPSTVSEETRTLDSEPTARTDVWDSHIAVSFGDDVRSEDVLDNWLMSISKEQHFYSPPTPPRKSSAHLPLGEDSVRLVDTGPIRPAASSPPTPVLESHASTHVLPAIRSAKHSHLCASAKNEAGFGHSTRPPPKISLPHEEFPVKHPSMDDDVEIRHPTPRRFASHPLLSDNAIHTASGSYSRSVSDSPVPPPRSPLRNYRSMHTFEEVSQRGRGTAPRLAPSVMLGRPLDARTKTIRPTVITDCTGPIKRPKSRSPDTQQPADTRGEREKRTQARKLRDRPSTASIVEHGNPDYHSRQKLKNNRLQNIVPELRPPPLITHSPSTASSEISWRKVTQSTHTPVSPLSPKGDEQLVARNHGRMPVSPVEQPTSHFSPVSPSKSVISTDTNITSSPTALTAESVPRVKARSGPKPPRLVLKEVRQYAPRPRSASMKERSRQQTSTPPRPATPVIAARTFRAEDAPPLPSPPPNRALPPTPPRSRSQKAKQRHGPRADQTCSRMNSAKRVATGIDARLEALEKQNALLSAALMAVLKTNGSYNLPQLADGECTEASSPAKSQGPMAWEHRIARRSAASHAGSSSNGSALEMYMRTRRGSKGAI